VKAGEFAPIERLQAEVEVGRAERAVARMEGLVQDATGRLAVLVGRSPTEPIHVGEVPAPSSGAWPLAGTLVRAALEGRVELKQAQLAIQREGVQRQLAEAGVWDGTEASLAAGTFSGLPGFTATVTWPIPVYRQKGAIAEAEANRLRAEAELAALRIEVELETRAVIREAEGAREAFTLHRTRLVPRAAEWLDQARRRYRAAEGSGLEVIAARRSLAEVQSAAEQALFELREAIARLEALSGVAL
jgi:outer membrane protein TolC